MITSALVLGGENLLAGNPLRFKHRMIWNGATWSEVADLSTSRIDNH